MANPAVTEPGGSSRVTAEVVNPDSIPLTFSWVASGGSISGAEAQALWVAPQSTGEFTISVVIKDSKGRTASGSIGVYVQAASSSKPAPTPTPTAPKITTLTADPTVTEPSGTSSITAEVANPDNVLLTFSWAASGGSITGTQAQALWVAPQSTGEFTISVTTKDSYGRTASASVPVSVQAIPSAPTPTPTPTPTGTRDPRDWPFAQNDPWNMPIGTGAVQQDITGWSTSPGSLNVYFNANAHTAAFWRASDTDPLRNVSVANLSGAHANPQPDPAQANYCSEMKPITVQIRIPDRAIPSPPLWPNGDSVAIIFEPNGRYAWELYGATKNSDGNWTAYGLWKHDLTLDGWSNFRCKHGGRAANAPWIGGIVRAGELQNGVKHALSLVLGPNMISNFAPGGRGYVWPASASDGDPINTNVFESSLLFIPSSVDLDALNFQTVEGKNVARALQLYGGYVIDGTSSNNTVIFNIDYNARAEVPASGFGSDLRLAVSKLKVMSNAHSSTGGQPSWYPGGAKGGGTPLAPLALSFAQLRSFDGYGEDVLASNPRRKHDTSIPLAAAMVALLPLHNLRQACRNQKC